MVSLRHLVAASAVLGLVLLGIVLGSRAQTVDAGAQSSSRRPAEGASAGEEFVGPFSSWSNLRTGYGAIGDGVADDSAPLQRALDDLGQSGRSPVLFIPAGRYRITKTLTLQHALFLSIVGADPDTTSIVWDGPAGGTMFLVNGLAYSRFTRLTWDGRGTASVAVEQSWDAAAPNFDTANEYPDSVFVDVEFGIHGGFKGHGFAETAILRSRFLRNTKAGIALGNFNALDVWVWYSTFEDCGIGITNDPGAGNFRVYASTFKRSKVSDLSMQNTGGFSARGNYSIASKAFFVSRTPISHPATIDIQGNTILDPEDARVIRLSNQGPGLLLDNTIRSLPGAVGPTVSWRSLVDADVTSIGNTFTTANAVSANGRLVSIANRVVSPTAIDVTEPRWPGTWRDAHRRVFDVSATADGAEIQDAIDRAARIPGRPVVHIPFGEHVVSQTLTVPPGDVQIVGDGFTTVLVWAGSGRGPVLRLAGPTQTTLRELQVDAKGVADAISVENVAQSGARVYLDGVETRSGREANLLVDHVGTATVDLVNFGHAYLPTGASVKVMASRATIFSGASSGNRLSYDVSDGGRLLVRDTWYEGDAPEGFARIHDDGVFTMQASRVSSPIGKDAPAFTIAGLNGRVSILTTHIDDRIVVTGDGRRAQVLGLGTFREHGDTSYFTDEGTPPARVLMINARQRAKVQGPLSVGSFPVADIGTFDAAFVTAMLEDARGPVAPAPLTPRPAGVSDVRMFRVWAANGLNNIRLSGGLPGPVPRP